MVDMSIGRHALRKVLAESTVRQVAARLGVGKSSVNDWANGKHKPNCEDRLRCLAAYGIQIIDWDRLNLSEQSDNAGCTIAA
jgi:transcriptional regulator with XRE-family HTH domain